MERTSFYLGALLHDIGKFIERAKDEERTKTARKWTDLGLVDIGYAHRRYGADFVEEFESVFNHLGVDLPAVKRYILYHHRGKDPDKTDYDYLNKDVYVKMIRIADSWASYERKEDQGLKPQEYFRSKLVNIFSLVQGGKESQYLDLNKLNLNNMIPDSSECRNPTTDENKYKNLVDSFTNEFGKISNKTQLFSLLEKYFSSVPAQSPIKIKDKEILYKSDISLFDHSRVTAAIAMCLYDEYVNGNIDDSLIFSDAKLGDKPIAMLVQVDFSGIQSFIFRVKSKEAARNLKGRSFYLQLLSDVIANYLLDELNLPISNLLYNGGGNFYILAPKSREEKLKYLQKEVTKILTKHHRGEIYVAIGYKELIGKDFNTDFSARWREVSEQTGKIKSNRFSEVNYEGVFEPFDDSLDDEQDGIDSYKKLTSLVQKGDSISLIPASDGSAEEKDSFPQQKIIREFGYNLRFGAKNDNKYALKLNDTNFLPDYAGFKFSVVNLPILEFEKIAGLASGDKKLAYLKMDVDNLGWIFKEGLDKKNRTISRVAVLSRMFKLFFEGYVNVLIKKYEDKIYPVYSGGDDTFLIGAWDSIFQLAEEINSDFRKFVANNPKITLSASLNVFHPKFPVIRAAAIADETLEKGKTFLYENETQPSKNKIVVLEEVFNWKEFEYLKDFEERVCDLIQNKNESRGLLDKIYKSTLGFNKLIEQTKRKKLDMQKVWRFNYFLRDMKVENAKAKENLIKTYRSMILHNLMYFDKDGNNKGYVSNPMLIPIATRWAELRTKRKTDQYGGNNE